MKPAPLNTQHTTHNTAQHRKAIYVVNRIHQKEINLKVRPKLLSDRLL